MKSIILRHTIVVFTDHKNLTQEALWYTSERLMRWQLLMKEFGLDIKYIKRKAKSIADAISRFNYSGESLTSDVTLSLEELFTLDKDDMELFPMSLQVIEEAQESCTDLQDRLK
eukprot:9274378-Ditylum_brightwellii.AAC.1